MKAQATISSAQNGIREQLISTVEEYRAMRMDSAGASAVVSGAGSRGRYGNDVKKRRQEITQLVNEAKAAGMTVQDEIDTPFADYKCYEDRGGCGYYGRMRLQRNLVTNEQMRVCPECGMEQRDRCRPVY